MKPLCQTLPEANKVFQNGKQTLKITRLFFKGLLFEAPTNNRLAKQDRLNFKNLSLKKLLLDSFEIRSNFANDFPSFALTIQNRKPESLSGTIPLFLT